MSTLSAAVVLPPPTTGMTVVTQKLMDALEADSTFAVRVYEVRRPPGSTQVDWIIRKHLGLLAGTLRAIHRTEVVYIVCESETGLLSTAARLALVRLSRRVAVVHHHTSSYVATRRRLFDLALRMAPRRTIHLVLSDGVSAQLRELYPRSTAHTMLPLPNTFAVPRPSRTGPDSPGSGALSVGFVGNQPSEKGLGDAYEAVKTLRRSGAPVSLQVAGASDTDQDRELLGSMSDSKFVALHGPLSHAEMDRFYDQIHVLALPSRYSREAQPMVILEALSRGIPVLAYPVGDIGRLLGDSSFLVADRDALATQLDRLLDPKEFTRARLEATTLFRRFEEESRGDLARVCDEIRSCTNTTPK